MNRAGKLKISVAPWRSGGKTMPFKLSMDIRHIAHKQLHGGEGSLRERLREPQSTPTKKAYFHSGWYLEGRNRMKKKGKRKESLYFQDPSVRTLERQTDPANLHATQLVGITNAWLLT